MESYTNLFYQCDCGHNAEEIDPMLFDCIVKLNELGFYTDCCCEGHYDENKNVNSGAYIMFLSSNKKYSDGLHVLDKRKERFLKKHLKKHANELMKWYFDSKWSKSIMLEVDYDSDKTKELLENLSIEKFKKIYIDRFKAIVTGLEISYKLKNNRKVW